MPRTYDGRWSEWDSSGNLKRKCCYHHGQKNGKEMQYFAAGGIKSEYHYSEGIKQGKFKEMYINGVVKMERFFSRDLLNGEIIERYENGQLRSKAFFAHGAISGEYEIFYNNGNPQEVGSINNKCNGKLKRWYKNGLLERQEYYVFSKPFGRFVCGIKVGKRTKCVIIEMESCAVSIYVGMKMGKLEKLKICLACSLNLLRNTIQMEN